MDDHLRQDGVSDLKVPKDMHRLGAAFFGRHRAYISALKAGDRDALRSALRRNVFADEDIAGLDALTAYVEAAARIWTGRMRPRLRKARSSGRIRHCKFEVTDE